MKKLFPEKKVSRKSLLEFLDKKGFYIILILCIAVVGATAVFVTTRNITSSNRDFNMDKMIPEDFGDGQVSDTEFQPDDQSPIDVAATLPEEPPAGDAAADKKDGAQVVADNTDSKAQQKADNTKADSTKADSAKADNTKAAAAASAKKTPNPKAPTAKKSTQKFIMPAVGEVTFAFAQDKLVYSKTLEDWRTHSGLDIAAERGTVVKAAADGVVSEIINDPRFGITVVVDHQNGLKTVYSNLASDDMVNPNQILKQGDVIGSVGNTALFESAEQSHLHFEVLKDNEPVNPETYLALKE